MIYKVSVVFHKDFVEIDGDEITVGIKSKPQKGEANKELVIKISKHFGVPRSNVRIKAGEKSRKKIVEVIQ